MERRCRILRNSPRDGLLSEVKKGPLAVVLILSLSFPFWTAVRPGSAQQWSPDPAAVSGGSPSGTLVTSFKAFENAGRVVLEWRTAPEIGTVGFFLEREDPETGGYIRVGGEFLPGLLTAPQGGVYRFVDHEASLGKSHRYRLREVTAKGLGQVFGPYAVSVERGLSDPSGGGVGLDEEADLTGYSRKPHGLSAARKARIQAMGREQALFAERGEPPHGDASRSPLAALPTGVHSWARILVEEAGLYHLDRSAIASALGMPEAEAAGRLQRGQFLLSSGGVPVAYAVSSGNAGILFYAEGIVSIYTRRNVYRLEVGAGVEMPVLKGKGPKPLAGRFFTETVHFEKDLSPLTSLFSDPEADYWIWDYLVAGNASCGRRTFTVNVPGVLPGGRGSLKVNLVGGTWTPHHAVVMLNGRTIGEAAWVGAVPRELDLSFDSSVLLDGNNTVEVTGLLDPGVPYSVFYVDSFDVGYPRSYRALGNRLLSRGDANPVVSIDGFNDPRISVYDLSDPKKPKVVSGITVDRPDHGNYRVSFVPAAPSTPYLALSGGAVRSAAAEAAQGTASLKDPSNDADYLVIAPPALTAAARGLADYRGGQGRRSLVVNFQDILDEFNHGISSPKAIQVFLSYAHENWRKPPRYVVLAGEGTYDYRDNLGYGDSLLPPLMVLTPYGLYPSDNRLADVVGNDGVPEMAVGRLPVLTSTELGMLTEKLMAYEGAQDGDWRKMVLMAADNPDAAGYFTGDSDALFALLPDGYRNERNKFYLGVGVDARGRLLKALNDGALILNYLGHGGMDRLAQEGLLKTSDVAGLVNGDRLPIVTSMGCLTGHFAVPGYDSITEALVMRQGGGAVASWAATGLSYEAPGLLLARTLFTALFHEGKTVLGDAVLSALRGYAAESLFPPFIVDIYNILGDPALDVNGPQ